MHELSIVQSIVDIAIDEMVKSGARAIEKIELEIGTQAGVEFHALDFAWDVGVRNTPLQDAQKVIHKVQATARCSQCNHVFPVDEPFPSCPLCREVLVQVMQGKELKVKSLVLI